MPVGQEQSRVTLADLRTPNQFQEFGHDELTRFFAPRFTIVPPSQRFIDIGSSIQDSGASNFEPLCLPGTNIDGNSDYAGLEGKPRPSSFLLEQARRGKANVTLRRGWVWVNTSVRPAYKDGKQMFENDETIGRILSELRHRKENGIVVPDWYAHIPENSRFGVSADETERAVYPELARIWAVRVGEVTDLTAAEFYYAGVLRYPHFGEANTWEWFADKFGAVRRLCGGDSGVGGLSDVYYGDSGGRGGVLAFRPVVFPQQ